MDTDITYQTSCDGVRAEDLTGFFVGWPRAPDRQTHLRILRGSDAVVLARAADGRVVGFVTALTDGVLSAYIPLLEVLPDHRGQGIGTALVRQLLDHLGPLYMTDLLCDPGVQPFYERLGLNRASGMMLRRYDAQGGVAEGRRG